LVAEHGRDIASVLTEMPEEERRSIGEAARRRVLAGHTAARRAKELETHLLQLYQPAANSRPAVRETAKAYDSRNIPSAETLD
jgi:hypothetical protein